MAKYDATKFFWLQLKEDFFDEDAIDWLEEQPNGKEYSLFYLKLCLKSLRTNGVLIRRVGNMLVPYDHVKLGELTKTNPDTVMVAMNLLIKIGLVHKLDNGELYLTQVENMIGSQSKSAFKKQQQRLGVKNQALLESGQKEDNCPPKIEKEKELDLELEEDKKKKSAKAHDIYFQNTKLNSLFIDFLELRKKLKAVNSDRAIKMLISELIKYDEPSQIQMLENSILNSWKSVYPLKTNTYNNNNSNKPVNNSNNVTYQAQEFTSDVNLEDAEKELMEQMNNSIIKGGNE